MENNNPLPIVEVKERLEYLNTLSEEELINLQKEVQLYLDDNTSELRKKFEHFILYGKHENNI